jgi:hypothetical protein
MSFVQVPPEAPPLVLLVDEDDETVAPVVAPPETDVAALAPPMEVAALGVDVDEPAPEDAPKPLPEEVEPRVEELAALSVAEKQHAPIARSASTISPKAGPCGSTRGRRATVGSAPNIY